MVCPVMGRGWRFLGRNCDGRWPLCWEFVRVQDSLRTLSVWAIFMQNSCCLLLMLITLFRQCKGSLFLRRLGTKIVLYLSFPVERRDVRAIVVVMGVLLPLVCLLRLVITDLRSLRSWVRLISVVSDLYLLCRVRFSGGAGAQLMGLRVVVICLVMLLAFGRPVVICSKDIVCPILGCRTKCVSFWIAQGTFIVRNLCLNWVAVEPTWIRTVTRLVGAPVTRCPTVLVMLVVLVRLALHMWAPIVVIGVCRDPSKRCRWILLLVSIVPVRLTTRGE